MNKKFGSLAVGLVFFLLLVLGLIIWQKSQVKVTPKPEVSAEESNIDEDKFDLSSQPEWVQNLQVSVIKGRSSNGLENVTVNVGGIPKGLIDSLGYVMQYETTNKGTQGALSTEPIDVKGESVLKRTIDLGTCSTRSCVRHEGVAKIELELDFTSTSSEKYVWAKIIDL